MGKSTFNMNKIYGLTRKAAIVLPAAITILGPGTPQQKGKQLSLDYFGVNPDDGSFKWERLQRGWMPGIAAQVVTRVIPAVGKLIRSLF